MTRRPSILMVTGAYFPETSGGGLQARAVARALRGEAAFRVLTTSTDKSLPARAEEDGVPVRRVYVDVRSRLSQLLAGFRIASHFVRSAPAIDLVNLHGFSRKAILLIALARLFRKPFVLTLQTGRHDEPPTVRASGALAYWAFAHADLYLSVSPGLSQAYLDAGLAPGRLRQVSNAVDVDRFSPGTAADRNALRAELQVAPDVPIVLYVGFFSRDKRPDLLYRAWARTAAIPSVLVLVGATRPIHAEIDPALADDIRRRAAADGLDARVRVVEATQTIERCCRAADLYVLASVREGMPIALLEAMASGVACVASRLPGSTDAVVEPNVSGILVEPDDEEGFAAVIARLLRETDCARRLGEAARSAIVERYSIQRTAGAWLDAYRHVLDRVR